MRPLILPERMVYPSAKPVSMRVSEKRSFSMINRSLINDMFRIILITI